MGKRARCKICKMTFGEQRSVVRHMESTHNMVKFECKLCDKVFARLDILHQHYKSKSHKTNDKMNKQMTHPKSTNESLNKTGAIDNRNKLVSYNTDGSINDGTSNIETGDFDDDVDEEIDSTLPIIYSYDDEDSILSMNWEDSIEHFRATAEPAEERSNAGFNSLATHSEGNPRQAFNSAGLGSLPTQFEGNVFTYSELIRIAKGERDSLNAPGPSNEDHQMLLPSDIKVDNDGCITIPSDDEEPPDKRFPSNSSKTEKGPFVDTLKSPEKQLAEPADLSPKRLRRDNDVLVDSNVFDLLKKKTLDANDEDQMFLLSILSDFRKVLPHNKLKVKIKIAQAIADGS